MIHFLNFRQFTLDLFRPGPLHSSLSLSLSKTPRLRRAKGFSPLTKKSILSLRLSASYFAPPLFPPSSTPRMKMPSLRPCRSLNAHNLPPAALSRRFTHSCLFAASAPLPSSALDSTHHKTPISPPAFRPLQRTPTAGTSGGTHRQPVFCQDPDQDSHIIFLQKGKADLTAAFN